MKKTFLQIGSACGLNMLLFGSSALHAFCTQFDIAGIGTNCVGQGHILVTRVIEGTTRPYIWNAIWDGNYAQDNLFGEFRENHPDRHMESCRFADGSYIKDGNRELFTGSLTYINNTYQNAISYLNPASPEPFTVADRFGKLLHTVQDFYSHSNWINLMNLTSPNPVSPTDIFDDTLGEWTMYEPLDPIRDDIILGQISVAGLPAGWSVNQDETSETPIFLTNEGTELRGLITVWNKDGACPDVRDDKTIDEYSHVFDDETGVPTARERTLRLVHGESKVSGTYHFVNQVQEGRPCHDGYPTYVCLQKDHPGRPDYGQVLELSRFQTAHEWCRLLHLSKDSEFGYPATSILMTLLAKPEDYPNGPHPRSTQCEAPPGVVTGRPGPIEVIVEAQEVSLSDTTIPTARRNLTFALYTGDMRRSVYRTKDIDDDSNSTSISSRRICVNSGDTLVATVWGWDDYRTTITQPLPSYPEVLDRHDRILRGVTKVLSGPGFEPGEHVLDSEDMSVRFTVDTEQSDLEGDGLSSCGEIFYGTDPNDADTDDDGLTDGAEVNTYGTDPLDADTDDDGLTDSAEVSTHSTDPNDADTDHDGLTDGAEVNTYSTIPLDADTDDDGLTDGAEVNTHGTDPLNADTDDDGLSDSQELQVGTNPLNPDTDGDGLPDGQDVDWIEEAILAIPEDAINGSGKKGNRNAMLNLLADAEAHLLRGKTKPAMDKLTTLRSRIDGCGSSPDSNDWVTDCAEQVRIRQLLDILIANV